MTTREFIDAALRPDPRYLAEKLEDHRVFTAAMCALVTLVVMALWTWTYTTDPTGGRYVIPFQLGTSVFMLGLSIGMMLGVRHPNLAYAIVTGLLAWEILYTIILQRLGPGTGAGLGGYMYFFLLPILLLQGFAIRVSLVYLPTAALLPHFLALCRITQGFDHLHYAALIWPAALVTAVAQLTSEHDYLQRYRLRRQLIATANTDALTGLSNRRHFMQRANDEIRRLKRQPCPLACMMMDIDHFKKINDEYGHPSGDKVIKAFAAIIRKQVRDVDLVGRLGGEEFAVMLLDSALRNGRTVAERIRAAVAEERVVDDAGKTIAFTVSIGVTEWQEDANPDPVLARADEALYQAKTKGRNRVCCKTRSEKKGAASIDE